MRTLPICLLPLLVMTLTAGAEMREFTDAQGRKIKAELVETGLDWIKIKRADGQKFTLQLDKLSADDRAWLEEQAKKPAIDESTKKPATAEPAKKLSRVPAKILEYCKSKMGQQVGNGECWTLADECFKACRLRRPGAEIRVWGRLLDLKKEKPQPGDILECRSAKFSNGAVTAPEHTAIVTGLKDGKVLIVHQNWGGVKKVEEFQLDPAGLVSGELLFYRPR